MNMYAVLLLAACAAMASADCGTLQRLLVKKEWTEVFGSGVDRERFGTKLWREVFRLDNSLRDFFVNVNGKDIMSAKFSAHSMRVLGGLDMCIALLDDEDTLNAELAHLKSQHDERGIAPENYDTLAEALMYVLPDFLGANFHNSAAWADCFGVIKSGITG